MPEPNPQPESPDSAEPNESPEDNAPAASNRRRKNKHQSSTEKLARDLQSQDVRTAELKNQKLAAQLQQAREVHDQIIALRTRFSLWILLVVIVWKLAVLLLLGLCASKLFTLADTVLLALVTTTTANILGLLVIVLKYVFPVPDLPGNKGTG